jgi:hypothetical protein
MWGLVVSAVTIGASFLGKTKDGSTSSSTSESTQLIIAKNGSDRNFLSGMGTCSVMLMFAFRS